MLPTVIKITGKIIEIGFIVLIVATPLAFGSTPGWASIGIEITVAIITVSFLIHSRSFRRFQSGSSLAADRRDRGAFLKGVYLFLILGVVIQSIPLPGPVIRLISPATYKFYLLSGELTASGWPSLSFYPSLTVAALSGVIVYGAVVWVIFRYQPADKPKLVFITRLILAVIITGFVISLLGIIQKYSGEDKICGIFTSPAGNFFGTYINRNHFAGYIEMVIPLSLGVLIFLSRRRTLSRVRSLRARIVESDPRWLLFLFISLIMITAHVSTLSRGGTLAFLGSMIFFIFFTRKLKLTSGQTLLRLIAVVLILLILAVCYFGYQPIIERFEVFSSRGRVIIWRDTWDLFRSHPLLGTGLGTFRDVFQNIRGEYRIYQRRHPIFYNVFPFHAENDYLQLMAEMGVWGIICLLLLVGWYFRIILTWKPRRRMSPPSSRIPEKNGFQIGRRAIVLGTATGIVAFLFHGLVDFNFHIPANALLFFILAGVSLSTALEVRPDPGPDRMKKRGSQSFCMGYNSNLNHEGHEDHEGDVNRK